MTQWINIPSKFTVELAPAIVYRLQELANQSISIGLDFSAMTSFDNFAGLYLAVCVGAIDSPVEISGLNSRFAEFIGLKKALATGKLPVVASLPELDNKVARYMKMCAYRVPERAGNHDDSDKMAELASTIADKLLPNHLDQEGRWAVRYAIKEVLLNIIQHSNSNRFFFCAQYSPKSFDNRNLSNTAEFAIIDRGDGLLKSLSRNGKYGAVKYHYEAIELCTRKGVSRLEDAEEADNVYGNRGLGLYLLSEFGKRGRGSVIISTGDTTQIRREDTPVDKGWYKNYISGTAIGVRLDLNHVSDFRKIVNGITFEALRTSSNTDDSVSDRSDPRLF